MGVVTAARFASGMSWTDYLQSCSKHEEMRKRGYAAVSLTPEQRERLQRWHELGIKVLVLEEDWCGDAARSGPVLARLAAEAGIEARWFLRDENLDLMDQYLENGTSRAIPVIVFMDRDYRYIAHWGSRPAHVRAATVPHLPLPPQDDPRRAEAFERFRTALQAAYDENYPAAIVDELLDYVERGLASRA